MKYIFLLLLLVGPTACASPYPKSDHYDGSRFFMPAGPKLKSFWTFLKWRFTSESVDWPRSVTNQSYKLPSRPEKSGVLTFINHSTFLVQLPGITILTDPIFSERAGPFEKFGPIKRTRNPGLAFKDLPKIDVVLISHNHYDHLDLETLIKLNKIHHPVFLVALGDKLLLEAEGIKNIQELDWWNERVINNNKITFTPAQHWSARGLFDKNKSLWGGFFITSPSHKIYFAGDTGYTKYFKLTQDKLGNPDISLLPIGAYAPRWFMKEAHLNPEDALRAHKDLGSKLSFGMHFGTFKLSDEGYDSPLKDLEDARKKQNISVNEFRVLDFGESFNF
jgi:L-ascorbate metabolism protein UlaG (beta-lactamase superfamily)